MIVRFSLLLIPLLGWSVSFQEFSDRVYENALGKLENDAKVKSVEYAKKIALSSDPMNLGVSSRKIRADDSRDNGYEYSLMSEWTIKTPGLKSAQASEWNIVAQNLTEEGEFLRRMSRVDLKHEWLLYEAALQRASVYDAKVRVSQKGYESGKKQVAAGRMSRLELVRLESEYVRSKEEWQKSLMEAEHIQHRLQEDGMSSERVVIDDLTFGYLTSYDDVHTRIASAIVLESIQQKIEHLSAQLFTARQSRIESYTIGIGMTQEPTQKSLDVALNIPIAWQDRQEQMIASLMQERSSLEHQKRTIQEKLRLSVHALSEHLKEREEMIRESIKSERRYESLFDMSQKAFEGGVMGQFEYLASKKEFFDAQLRSIELREAYIDEMHELESRLGRVIQ